MAIFDINFESKASIVWLGNQEVPLLVIDEFYKFPLQVRDFAFERSFPESQAYYPGRHQPLDDSIAGIGNFCTFISRVLSHATKKSISAPAITTDFSILTTPERALVSGQGAPHIDATPMLGVIYLNTLDFGGTVFFRNKTTGSMAVASPEEKSHYEGIQSRQQTENNASSEKYITSDNGDWEKVRTIDGKLNRLVIWPGNVWHSVEVKVPPELGRIDEKRLTQRVIVNSIA